MTAITRSEVVETLRLISVEYKAWAKQREESNKNPRAPRKWTAEEIATTRRQADVLAAAAAEIERGAKPKPQAMEVD